MNWNGFGSWRTILIVSVAASDGMEAEKRLDIPPFEATADPLRAYFPVSMLAGRRGDDEAAWFEIALVLETAEPVIDWRIEWDSSAF
ncbi:hypothetical protein [Rhizobium sp. Leaf371]|uniref:hypothetical protein n=1 Tax=Rhizobium sp. Leaf371 TaxID=1736355 RepID=UPI0012E98B60|nr:hypothetical protein [Rhizobium sp. Leaf371]